MDKFEKILDIIDHQEKYTDDEIREILRDEECHKLYQTMQEVDSALLKQSLEEADGTQGIDGNLVNDGNRVNEVNRDTDGNHVSDGKRSHRCDVDEAWQEFSQKYQLDEEVEKEKSRFSWRKIAASIVGFILISGIAFAAIHTYISKSQEPMPIAENTEVATSNAIPNDTSTTTPATETKAEKPAVHKTFVNVTLDKMLAEIAAFYDLQVKFEGNEAKSLRLYYEWDSHTQVEEVVKELNQFDNVDIVLKDNQIIVQ